MRRDITGFSLVELLIAMTLLLMITSLGSYAYSAYSDYWQKSTGKFDVELREVKGMNALFEIVGNVKPYVLKDEDNQPYYYFEGGKSVLRSITQHSITNPEYPAVFELKVTILNDGLQRLLYREAPMLSKPLIHSGELPIYSNEIVLLEGFSDFSFEFYGVENYEIWLENQDVGSVEQAKWYGYYSGKDTMLLPSIVKVSIEDTEGNSSLKVGLAGILKEQISSYFTGEE